MVFPRWLLVAMPIICVLILGVAGVWFTLSENRRMSRIIELAKNAALREGVPLHDYEEPSAWRLPQQPGLWIVMFPAKRMTRHPFAMAVDDLTEHAEIMPGK
jgi:hypothetical protein